MKKIYIILLFPFLVCGCIITNTPGFHSGYKKIAPDQKENIIFVEGDIDICNIKNDRKIYAVTAAQLLNCLQNNDSTIVYFWSPNCSSKSCVLLDAAQNYCDKQNYRLYVITEYYDLKKIEAQNNSGLSLFSINHKYYKTDYCNKYVKLFSREMIKNKDSGEEDDHYRYFLFHQDSFVRRKENLFDP